MTRPGVVADSHRRPLSWVIVAVSLAAYLGLLVALGVAGVSLRAPLPWWVVQAVPPLFYALLVFVVARPRSAVSLCGGALLLWAVHLLLGMLTEPIGAVFDSARTSAATWSFPPAPLPQILWVPVLLVPLRDLLKGGSASRSTKPHPSAGRRPAPERKTAAATTPVEKPVAPATVRKPFDKPSTPQTRVTSMAPSIEPRQEAAGRPVMSAPVAARALATPPPVAPPKEEAGARAQRLTDELLTRETSDEPLQVTAMRVLAQLPVEALAVPVDRLAEELGAQLFLSIPRRLALAQLSGGIVRAGWDVLAPQVPSHLLAMSHDAIRAALPDGCVVPIDEIVRQFSPETFLPVAPAPDLRGIEAFPAPFQPLEVMRGEVEIAAPGIAPGVPARVGPEPPEEISGIVPVNLEPADSANALDARHSAPLVPVEPPVKAVPLDSLVHAPMLPPQVEEARPERAADDNRHLLHELAALLSAVGPLAIEVRMVDGVTMLSAMSPAVDERALTAAELFLPLMRPGRWLWPVDQVTLRSARAALILTPLAGGPVLAAAVPPGGGLALLELRCRQAAAAHAAREGARHEDATSVDEREERDEPDLLDVEPSTRTHEVASSLGALGTVSASSLRDPETDRVLYLFLPAGSDVRAIGALAHDVSCTMRQADEAGVTFRTAALRSGPRRMVIRLPEGSSDAIVAAGQTARPGLAYRQVERAAAALAAI